MSLLLIYVRPFISQLYTISYIESLCNGTKPREGYIRFIARLPIKPNSSKMNSSHAWTFQSETISFESLRKLCYAPTSKTSTFIGSWYCLLYIHTCTTKPGRDYVVFFITCLTCMQTIILIFYILPITIPYWFFAVLLAFRQNALNRYFLVCVGSYSVLFTAMVYAAWHNTRPRI